MKYEEVNKILNTNKSEEKLFTKKNENTNYKNIQTEYKDNISTSNDNFAPDNIAKSCVIPNTTKNKNSSKNMENFQSISPINNKNINYYPPNKQNFNSENANKNHQIKNSNQINNNIQTINNKKSVNTNFNSNDNLNLKPILIIDVKLKEGIMKHIKVYEGDTAEKLSNEFAELNSKIKNFLNFKKRILY